MAALALAGIILAADRRRLVRQLRRKDDRIIETADRCAENYREVTQVVIKLREVLSEISRRH